MPLCPAQVTSRANTQLLRAERILNDRSLSAPARLERNNTVTDEELQALRERYRRAGDEWTNQCRVAQAAKDRANEMFLEHARMGREIRAEESRRSRSRSSSGKLD